MSVKLRSEPIDNYLIKTIIKTGPEVSNAEYRLLEFEVRRPKKSAPARFSGGIKHIFQPFINNLNIYIWDKIQKENLFPLFNFFINEEKMG